MSIIGIFAGTPLANGNSIPKTVVHQNGDSLDPTTSDESNQGPLNGKTTIIDEDTTNSFTDNSPPSIAPDEETNDSVVSISESTKDSVVSEDSNSLGDYKRPSEDDSMEPPSKKLREDLGDK